MQQSTAVAFAASAYAGTDTDAGSVKSSAARMVAVVVPGTAAVNGILAPAPADRVSRTLCGTSESSQRSSRIFPLEQTASRRTPASSATAEYMRAVSCCLRAAARCWRR